MRITLAQVATELGDLDANLARAEQIVRQAAAERSELVVFPELFLTGYALGRVDEDVSLSADDERLTKLGSMTPHIDVLIGLYASSTCRRTTSSRSASTSPPASRCAPMTRATAAWRRSSATTRGSRTSRSSPCRTARACCSCPRTPRRAASPSATTRRPTGATSPSSTRGCSSATSCSAIAWARRASTCASGAARTSSTPWGEIVCSLPNDEESVVTTEINLANVRKRRRQVPLVREARLGLLAREATRLTEEGGDA